MAELNRICEGAEREEIMERVCDRAVTILEKKIVSYSFKEFENAFENATETEMPEYYVFLNTFPNPSNGDLFIESNLSLRRKLTGINQYLFLARASTDV